MQTGPEPDWHGTEQTRPPLLPRSRPAYLHPKSGSPWGNLSFIRHYVKKEQGLTWPGPNSAKHWFTTSARQPRCSEYGRIRPASAVGTISQTTVKPTYKIPGGLVLCSDEAQLRMDWMAESGHISMQSHAVPHASLSGTLCPRREEVVNSI